MENKQKLVKVYSNQSKKARLKRNKNKFQRIWDAEKQTYIKVRKDKYPVYPKQIKKDWRDIDDSTTLKRRHKTPKKPKSVPANVKQAEIKIANIKKPENKQKARKEPICNNITKISGINYMWDSKTLHYKRAA